MIRTSQEPSQQRHHRCWRSRAIGVARVPENAQESVLGEWRGGPSGRGMPGKPVMGQIVMHVLAIHQSNQHIHIQQTNQGLIQRRHQSDSFRN